MKKTKQRILEAALKLFNQHGYVNVRLQHIADEASISIGNLVYHFSNKEEMLLAIYKQLRAQQKQLLTGIRLTPIFENFDFFIKSVFDLQQKYTFFYLDILELTRANEELKNKQQEHIRWQLTQLELLLRLNRARGAMNWDGKPERQQGLAKAVWRIMVFWPMMQMVEGGKQDDFIAYRNSVWEVLQAFFTPLGWREFEQLKVSKFTLIT